MSAFAVDSNVIVYALESDAGEKFERATNLLSCGVARGLRLPLQAVAETFTVLTRRKQWPSAQARQALEEIMAAMPTFGYTAASIARAMALHERHGIPYWDAQMIATATEHGCSTLLSEDMQDGRRFDVRDVGRAVRIVNPFGDANVALLTAAGLLDET
jgi:predicted nucleic acid-binding protein